MNKNIRKVREAGITLIALVVTIIVLLILAGVTLSLAINNGGLIERAREAKQIYKQAEQNDISALSQIDSFVEDATKTKYEIYVDGVRNKLLTRFYEIDSPYLTPNTSFKFEWKSSREPDSIIITEKSLYNNQNDVKEFDVKIKKDNENLDIERMLVTGSYYYYYWKCDDLQAMDYFGNEIHNIRPHLFIDGSEVLYDSIKYSGNGDYVPFMKNGQMYAIEAKIRKIDDIGNKEFYISKYGKYNNTSIVNNESYDQLQIELRYDDGRVFQKDSEEFILIVYELLDHFIPHAS